MALIGDQTFDPNQGYFSPGDPRNANPASGGFVGPNTGGVNPASFNTPDITAQLAQLGLGGGPQLNESGAPEIFQPGLIPYSASQSGSQSSSGLDFSNPFVAGITEQLSNYARNLEPNIQAGTEHALGLAREGGKGYLEGELTTTLNSLANRGILGSTEAKNILSDVGSRGVEGQRVAGLQAGLNEAGQKLQVPSILSQIAQLGQGSQATSGATSIQADPLKPFELAERFISNQTV